MAWLGFFATGQGVLALGILAALIVLAWDWRVALVALVLIQLGVAVLLVQVEGIATQTMMVQTVVIGLSAAMVGTSAVQVNLRRSGRQAGGWLFRLLVLLLLGAALVSLDLAVALPEIAPAIGRIFAWIGLIALVMLSLGDNPVFTITALLIWCVLGQALAAVYAPAPEVTVGIGIMELVLGLTASYLLLAERLQPMRHAAAVAARNSTNGAARNASPSAAHAPVAGRPRSTPRLPGLRRSAPVAKERGAVSRTTAAPVSAQPPQPAKPPNGGAGAARTPHSGSEDRERT